MYTLLHHCTSSKDAFHQLRLKRHLELFDILCGFPLVQEHQIVDACGVHVQHGLADMRREWLAQPFPHLVAIAFTFFKQFVVLKAESTDANALDLNQHVFAVDVDMPVCMPQQEVVFI